VASSGKQKGRKPLDPSIPGASNERQNLTVRMMMRRLTRLTNAFSKKRDNLKAALALHFAFYNLYRGPE
jgi:IS1 family transposase